MSVGLLLNIAFILFGLGMAGQSVILVLLIKRLTRLEERIKETCADCGHLRRVHGERYREVLEELTGRVGSNAGLFSDITKCDPNIDPYLQVDIKCDCKKFRPILWSGTV